MKKLIFLVTLLCQIQLCAQGSYNIDWINKDLSPYSSYTISEFKVNEVLVNYTEIENAIRFMDVFNDNMSKIGLEVDDNSVLEVLFNIQLDTLPAGFQRPEGANPEDRIIDLTLTLQDSEVNEKLVVANFSSITREPKKLNKEVKKMLQEFFREARISSK